MKITVKNKGPGDVVISVLTQVMTKAGDKEEPVLGVHTYRMLKHYMPEGEESEFELTKGDRLEVGP